MSSSPESAAPAGRAAALLAAAAPWAPAAVLALMLALAGAATILGESRGFEVKADGLSYYLYLRSLLFDGDLDFSNEIAEHDLRPNAVDPGRRTATGLVGNPFSVGPALLWSPATALAHALVRGANRLGAGIPADGFSWPYAAALELASVCYAFAGLLLTVRACRRIAPEPAATLASVAVFLGSPLLYYGSIMATMSHAMSFFAAALVLAGAVAFRERPTPRAAFLLGLAAGLATIVRWQDVVVLVFVAIVLGRSLAAPSRLLAFGCGFALLLPLQLAAWRVVYGKLFLVPQGGGFVFAQFHPLKVLLSPNHGLFLWHPLLAAALVGLVLLALRDPGLGWGAVALFAAFLAVNASVAEWWAGKAFGGRRFVALCPFFALGAAELWRRARSGRGRAALLAAAAALIAGNVLLMVLYQTATIRQVGDIG